MQYGYCRISTPKQNIDRQVRNILSAFPNAKIYKEIYTGTKTTGRKKLEEIVKLARSGDTIIFDSVSRMSRNADEGVGLYMQLYDEGVNLVFIKEPHINTATYSKALSSAEGRKLHVKKAKPAKEIIKKHCKSFGGTLSDSECITLAGISRNTYYKYKRELMAEIML